MQRALEPLGRPAVEHHHALAVVVAFGLLLGEGAFGHLDAVLFGDVLQRLDIAHPLVLHHEGDGVASLAAAEAFVKSFRGRDDERGSFFVMERATGLVIDSLFAQRDKIAHHLHDIRGGIYSVYGGFVYHKIILYFCV